MRKMRNKDRAFTLIELLIVVAIIAILAAIAVPNFLEAQTRSKVTRVKNDHRALATAMEAYRVDNNCYTVERSTFVWIGAYLYNTAYLPLTTPIAYVTSLPADPFNHNRVDPNYGGILNPSQAPRVGASSQGYGILTDNLGGGQKRQLLIPWVVAKYGPTADVRWIMLSIGPWATWGSDPGQYWGGLNGDPYSCIYDPTNGTVSMGLIWRTNFGIPN